MTNLQMTEQLLKFENNAPYTFAINKIYSKSSIVFPSNIIKCSISVKDFNCARADLNSASGKIEARTGPITSIGWGVEDISVVSNQVFFTGWMLIESYNGSGQSDACPDLQNSFLNILAIAECE